MRGVPCRVQITGIAYRDEVYTQLKKDIKSARLLYLHKYAELKGVCQCPEDSTSLCSSLHCHDKLTLWYALAINRGVE